MAISKRESRLRRWAKKLSGCLRHCQPHLRYKSDYLEIEKTGSQPVYRANNQNPPAAFFLVDENSLPRNQEEGILQKNPHGVLPWKESFQIQKAINQGMPEHSTHKHDSATDLSLRPFQTRPHEARKSHGPPKPPPKPTTGARICHRRPINPQAAFTSSNTVAGWDQDWDKPLHHRIGDTKAIWKSGSHRLMVRNKDSIRRLDSDKTTREKVKGRMVSDKRQASQVRSIESIEEMAEEDRLAYEEWTGIATQIAAEGPDIQEVRVTFCAVLDSYDARGDD
ncbi:hypothetical protein CFE70_000503 [Pyrenophora teres f. teres 0-1]